jgi:hypothetical protein
MKNTVKDFRKAHPVGGCRIPAGAGKMPMLKFGKIDVPSFVDNRSYCTAVEDQGAKPWCAAYTAAAFAENVLWRRDGRIREIEPEWIYKYAKAHDGDPDGDGTTLDCVLNALLSKGVFDGKSCKLRMVGKGWVGVDVQDVKAAIHRFGCFLAGFDITTEWYDLSKKGVVRIRGRKADSCGGHAVLVCGYNDEGVWIENSWGENWGDKGFGFLEWEAFRKQFMYGMVLTNCLNGFK